MWRVNWILLFQLPCFAIWHATEGGKAFVMIGFAPPLPEFRNLNEYVNIVQYALKSELTDDEIILAAEARAAKVSTIAFADWLSATRGTMFLPASSPPL